MNQVRRLETRAEQFSYMHNCIDIFVTFQTKLVAFHAELKVELASSQFNGSESSGSVIVVITKSNALSDTVVSVQITLTEHSSLSAASKHIQ